MVELEFVLVGTSRRLMGAPVPDTRPRVAFVTTTDTAVLHDDVDLPLQIDAFAAAGIDLVGVPWEDDRADWGSFDLVIMRSAWNYVDRLEQFRGWLAVRRGLPTLHNPVGLIEWNMDKRYLGELASMGVAVVPTRYAASSAELVDAVAAAGAEQIIVKPTISAGSRLTGRFGRGSSGAVALGERILAAGFGVMVQPFAGSVDAVGEIGTVCFDGEISHSFRKGPLLGDEGALRGGRYREEITAGLLTGAERELVLTAQRAVTSIARDRAWIDGDLLYGRYDLVTLDDGSPALLEAELFEPCFFLMVDPTSPRRFIEAVSARLSQVPGETGN